MHIKNIAHVAIVTGLLLLIPLALQLTIGTGVDGQGFNWKLGDFVFVGVLLFVFGLVYKFLATKTDNKKYRVAIGISVLLGILFVWVNVVNDFDILERLILSL